MKLERNHLFYFLRVGYTDELIKLASENDEIILEGA